jgi:hypothetical protein
MKIRCERLAPGRVLSATLQQMPSWTARDMMRTVLEIDMDGCPVQVEPPDGLGAVLVEASAEERARLSDAGYNLPESS